MLLLEGKIDRRRALQRLAALSMSGVVGKLDLKAASGGGTLPTRHPHIFITEEAIAGLRSLSDVQKSIGSGIHGELWGRIRLDCDGEIGSEVLTARSVFEGRTLSFARQNNPDYTILPCCGAAYSSKCACDVAD